MPEGPETLKQLNYIRSLFKRNLSSYQLVEFANLSKRFKLDLKSVEPAMDGNIVRIFCKGKFYFFELAGGISFVAHHGMNGWWSVEEEKHSHVRMRFAPDLPEDEIREEDIVTLYYVNVELGNFDILTTPAALNAQVNEIANGFIGDYIITKAEFLNGLKKFTPRKRLRDILFDQHAVCSGLGNYLIAEIFYIMEFHPMIKLGSLDSELRETLFEACREIVIGHFNDQLNKVVYDKEMDMDGNKVEKMKVGSRTAHWVPAVQTIGVPSD